MEGETKSGRPRTVDRGGEGKEEEEEEELDKCISLMRNTGREFDEPRRKTAHYCSWSRRRFVIFLYSGDFFVANTPVRLHKNAS